MPDRELMPREAMRRWINHLHTELAEETVETHYYRLKLFVEWCEGTDLECVGDLPGWTLDTYETVRLGAEVAPTTLQNEMKTLKKWLGYLERLELVEDGLAEKVHIPSVPDTAQSDEEMLKHDDARQLLEHFRDTSAVYGTDRHALLELAWHTGARVGGLRSLDLRDYSSDEQYVEFHHRPETDTPLKNKLDGERPVAFPEAVADVLDYYIDIHRHGVHCDHGRAPLFTTGRGRPSLNSFRVWSYLAPLPCRYGLCPHDQSPRSCPYKDYHEASKCLSSRSPHKIRTGSITWQLHLGFPPEVVAERVNATVETIDQYYDHASPLERLEERRRPYIDLMEFDD